MRRLSSSASMAATAVIRKSCCLSVDKIDHESKSKNEKSIKDKAVFMSGKIKELAKAKDIELKLRKKHC